MLIPSRNSGDFTQSRTKPCQWRAFLLESLCGILTVTWYVFALAEKSTFSGLTRLTKFADAYSEDPGKGGGEFSVLLDEAESSLELQYESTHAFSYEVEAARLNPAQNAHPLSGSRYHISCILILAGLTGLDLRPCQSQAIYGSLPDTTGAINHDAKVALIDTSESMSKAEPLFLPLKANSHLLSDCYVGRALSGFEGHEL